MNKQISELFDYGDAPQLPTAISFDPGEIERLTLTRLHAPARRHKTLRKTARTLLLAAVIASLLGATAYAAGFLGKEALLSKDDVAGVFQVVVGEDGTERWEEAPQGGYFLITRPQALPEDMDPAIRAKLENTQTAWDEWESWKKANAPRLPAVFEAPEGTDYTEYEENEDGSLTIYYYQFKGSREEIRALDGEGYRTYASDPDNRKLLETRTATGKERQEKREWEIYMQREGLTDYPGSSAKFREIAEQYGLALLGKPTVLYGSSKEYYQLHGRPDWASDEEWAALQEEIENRGEPAAEMLQTLSQQCCRGGLFTETPPYVDHLYWYEEGTFAVAFTQRTPGGKQAEGYLYNSMYGTLTSGRELPEPIEDISAYHARTHTAPDGTVLTVLDSSHVNGRGWHDASFAYAFLEDSFLVVKLYNDNEGLTEAEVNAILDNIQYTNINP